LSRLGDGSTAPSLGEDKLDVSPVPLGTKVTYVPIVTADNLHERRKSLEEATIVKLMIILKHPKEAKKTSRNRHTK